MKLEQLREQVLDANRELVRRGLVTYTFGNVSGISRQEGLIAIKPSGVNLGELKPADIVLTDLNGSVVEGELQPSSDLPTHLEIYKAFAGVGGVAHTHSDYATSWAQADREIPCYGTTHADYFQGAVPLTNPLSAEQIRTDYEKNTGRSIVRRFHNRDPLAVPAVLVVGHGPFTWGTSAAKAAFHAAILEEVARSAYHTIVLNSDTPALPKMHIDKHFFRKHGSNAYYGQK